MKCMEIYRSRYEPCNRAAFVFDLQRFAGGEKTEEPTPKKRADARKKGQVGRSQELNTAFVLLIGFFSLKLLWDSIYLSIANYTTYVFSNVNQTVDTENVIRIFIGIMTILALIGLAINFFQVGLTFNTESIEFKLDKLNPINGFGRIFSKRSLVELVKSFFKILVIGFFLYRFIHEQLLAMPQFMFFDLTTSLALVAEIIFQMAFIVIGVIMVMAFCDYGYQKWQTTQDLKMTKQEVKDELKQSEGDPQIKGKIRHRPVYPLETGNRDRIIINEFPVHIPGLRGNIADIERE